MPEETFQKIEVSDLDETLQIERLSFTTPWSKYAFIHEMDFANSVFETVKVGGKLVGYGGFWHNMDKTHITNIAIHPAFRRRGLGRRLLIHLLELAVEKGVSKATLEVRRSNEAAQRLYLGFGFEMIAVRKHYYSEENEDALVMWNPDIAAALRTVRHEKV